MLILISVIVISLFEVDSLLVPIVSDVVPGAIVVPWVHVTFSKLELSQSSAKSNQKNRN